MNLISGPGRKGIPPKSYNQTMKHEPGYSASPNLQKTLFYFKFMDLKQQMTYTVSYCSRTSIKEAQC